MKAVLASIRPRWCGEILSGRKTIEVRRTRPKLPPPFKTYIYCTGGDTLYRSSYDNSIILTKHSPEALAHHTILNRMVIAEFICDWCDPFPPARGPFAELSLGSLVPPRDLYEYAAGKTIFGWHISELKAYEKPLPITDFKLWNRTEENAPCAHEKWLYEPCETCRECNLKYPPQSWCYVEEV